ncbi:MAG: site-2 protease family protein [bacterium JZ-2024 1]
MMSLAELLLFFAFVLMSVILHELGHGWVSHLLGDPTPKNAGRLSLSPIRHLDPLGSLLPLILYMLGSRVLIGWAKPVPVNPLYYKNRRLGIFLVGIAGPAVNFLLALSSLFLASHLPHQPAIFLYYLALLNLALMLFNLLPIPPLDGSRIVQIVLPSPWLIWYYSLERIGFVLIFLILFLFPFSLRLLHTLVLSLFTYLLHFFSLPPPPL